MGLKIITEDDYQVMFCSITMQAFGPVHIMGDNDLQDFVDWLPVDPRRLDDSELNKKYYQWINNLNQ
jgi:hypothetical protein